MRLTRLRVAELRQFREPFELDGLQPGLNIFTGANEAGKSTLVRAIRAAFFERHRSTSVDDLRPYGDAAATPSVEIDFEIAGTSYRLTKSFLQRKRCELMVGTRRLEGVEAEDHLAERLGFQFALKGASREEHWGIPGLLWIEQGSAQGLRDSVAHAADHLRGALDGSLGEVAASGGDEVLARVRALRGELLTTAGKPRAAFQQAIADVQALVAEAAELERKVLAYREQVDQLRQLREAHAADALAQPWAALREQLAQAQAALQAVVALARQRDAERENLRRLAGLRELLAQQLGTAERQQNELSTRRTAVAEASARHEQAADTVRRDVLAEAEASGRLRAAREALALARQEQNRTILGLQFTDAQTRATEAAALLERAAAEHERGSAVRREALRYSIKAADLKTLRKRDQSLRELEIQQAAVATRLRFELDPGARLQLEGEAISGADERLLVAPATLEIPGFGLVHIAPGGSDLAELAREHATQQDLQRALLQRLGIASLADAEARDLAQRERLADAAAAEKALALLVPQGLEALRAELDVVRARQAEASAALARLPPAPVAPSVPLAEAESAHEAQREAHEAANIRLQQARQTLASAASQSNAARQELDRLSALLEDPARKSLLAARRADLVEAIAQQAVVQGALDATLAAIAAARPDVLGQDVERLRRSADEAERQHHARALRIVQIETELAAAGAQGLEEELATLRGTLAHAMRRQGELRRRAEALDHLLARLEHHRQALTRRLRAPLQRHLDRYLQLLFPAGQLEVDADLMPGALSRPGARGPQAADFETLSFGAREQMGVISRLAYADLLMEAQRPTLVILDDALVHSDEPRLAQMKRVLFDAAERHQVLLFTCHPARWRDMGVPLRALADAGRPTLA